jgi:hypothetical protein
VQPESWRAVAHSQNNSAIVLERRLQPASIRSLKAALQLEVLPGNYSAWTAALVE